VGNPDPRTLTDRVVVVTAASRGIGRDMAIRAATDGASVALLAKTETPNPKIAGTLAETAEAVTQAGGLALPLVWDVCDVRDAARVERAVVAAAEDRTPNFYLSSTPRPAV
jgi:citronellol/citronellal dehydrogenase